MDVFKYPKVGGVLIKNISDLIQNELKSERPKGGVNKQIVNLFHLEFKFLGSIV
jgi:hypothetical protein